jgi:hypothetical protein
MKNFSLVQNFRGYSTKLDKTNLDDQFLVDGSQNVLINDDEKVSIRDGYSLLGAASTDTNPIESSFDWQHSKNGEWNLRSYDDELEVYLGTVDGVAVDAWTRIADSWTAVDFSFAQWWDTSEGIDILLFVNGNDQIYDWSGGVTTLASANANSITKNGSDTWAVARFLTSGTRKVLINGTEYTYTGGEGTTTLTGVTPNPSGEAADSVVTQVIRTNDNEPADGAINDHIRVKDNQVYVGGLKNQEVSVSKNSDFTDYTFSSPRVNGEGALLTLDNPPTGFAPQGDTMLISAGRNSWYQTKFQTIDVGGTLSETLEVEKLKTQPELAAQSQDLILELGDQIVFVAFDNTLRSIGSVPDLIGLQIRTLSDPIKPDFDAATFTNGHINFNDNRIYIALPNDDEVFILQFKQEADGTTSVFWQPPQILPLRRIAIVGGLTHGHSSGAPESYKLFDGTNDNGNSISWNMSFAYRNYGDRINLKTFDNYYSEGYISANTVATMILNYNFDGFTQQLEKDIDGNDEELLFQPEEDNSLGNDDLGDVSLGGSGASGTDQNPKFRVIHELVPQDFYELQVVYFGDSDDAQFEILAHGANAKSSRNQPIKIKR